MHTLQQLETWELVDGFTSWIFLLSRDIRGGGSSSEQTAHATTSLYKEYKHTVNWKTHMSSKS